MIFDESVEIAKKNDGKAKSKTKFYTDHRRRAQGYKSLGLKLNI
jgi:hypothetical protein